MNLKPGWLQRQMHRSTIEVATWPESLRRAAGFMDDKLTPQQRREAAAILRARADELDGKERE